MFLRRYQPKDFDVNCTLKAMRKRQAHRTTGVGDERPIGLQFRSKWAAAMSQTAALQTACGTQLRSAQAPKSHGRSQSA
jgi:hypothetical protein